MGELDAGRADPETIRVSSAPCSRSCHRHRQESAYISSLSCLFPFSLLPFFASTSVRDESKVLFFSFLFFFLFCSLR